jgi:splicing factor 3B subunit 2
MAELSAAQKKLAHEEELRAARNRKKKLHRKEVKKQQRTSDADAAQPDDGSSAPAAAPAPAVEIEYVSKRDDAAEDPAFHEFAKVFERFSTAEELLGGAKPAQQAAADPDAAAAAAAKGEGADAAADADARPVSKTRLRKEGRISLAVLKTAAERPEVVELCDATSAEPRLLVYLKGYRHAVPVPQHWAQKRAYLQGKRGVEKKPFQLPGACVQSGVAARARSARPTLDLAPSCAPA